MLCYADKTFCPFHEECTKGKECRLALTEEVKANADKWWGAKDATIAVYLDRPVCFSKN